MTGNAPAPGPSRPRISHTSSAPSNKGKKRAVPCPSELSEPAPTTVYDDEPGMGNNDGRPPSKRARKAINCDPCRASKLKCDRARPCSSCVLRGTYEQCYPAGPPKPEEAQDAGPPVDPAAEFEKIRQSLGALEALVIQRGIGRSTSKQPGAIAGSVSDDSLFNPDDHSTLPPIDLRVPRDLRSPDTTVPGELGNTTGGLYTGSTSAAAHLITSEYHEDDAHPESAQPVQIEPDNNLTHAQLPNLQVVESLIQYYFDYCNWVYRHVNQVAFFQSWTLYKSGQGRERLTLALACIMMAIAIFYLPEEHEVRNIMRPEETQGDRFYDIALDLIQRYQLETSKYTLDLVELYLARCHYLTLTKRNPEEIWSLRGDLIKIGTAMGLHRDPDRLNLTDIAKERRRWAWWHIILLERWQSFMFGRPLAIASHHFDTLPPSMYEQGIDPSQRLYEPNWALMRLASILGDIMDKAVSLRPVPYEHIAGLDAILSNWYRCLPSELSFTDTKLKQALSSSDIHKRRLGVQHVVIYASFYHIRFTLHRPYSLNATGMPGKRSAQDNKDGDHSLQIAVEAAENLILLMWKSRPDFIANTSLAVPGHLNWAPFHLFSAAMFFTFQLVANPQNPRASEFRHHISLALDVLREKHAHANISIADKAHTILTSLTPLYSQEFSTLPEDERKQRKADLLARVRGLAFPYKDASGTIRPSASGLPENWDNSQASTSNHHPSPATQAVMGPQPNPYAPPQPGLSSQFGIAYAGGGGAVGDPGPSTLANRQHQHVPHVQFTPQSQQSMMASTSSSSLINPSSSQLSESAMMGPPMSASSSSSLSHAMFAGSPTAMQPVQQMQAPLRQFNFVDPLVGPNRPPPPVGPGRGVWGASMGIVQGEWDHMVGGVNQGPSELDLVVTNQQSQWPHHSWHPEVPEAPLTLDFARLTRACSQPAPQNPQPQGPPGMF